MKRAMPTAPRSPRILIHTRLAGGGRLPGLRTGLREPVEKLADAVTLHATPVGSGAVARTERIPIHERAGAVVIAWMRHQTTAYDEMRIPRIKEKRRETRRLLAEKSRQLREVYRKGLSTSTTDCTLQRALEPDCKATTGVSGLPTARFGLHSSEMHTSEPFPRGRVLICRPNCLPGLHQSMKTVVSVRTSLGLYTAS